MQGLWVRVYTRLCQFRPRGWIARNGLSSLAGKGCKKLELGRGRGRLSGGVPW